MNEGTYQDANDRASVEADVDRFIEKQRIEGNGEKKNVHGQK
jgi:hypothetical protein